MAANEKFILEFATQGVEKLDRVGDKIDGLKTKINGLSTAILGVGFGAFISGALQAADRVSDFSDATNISIASIKSFGAALDESGGKAKNTEKIINGFYAAIETANQGSIQARDAFASVGVSLKDLQNLDETQLLEKTLKGLSALPAGSERAAIATTLLTKAFRGVDPKAFWEALDPEKYKATEEATRKAAAAQQQLEEKFRTLQEGALLALEPILKMMGEHKLTTEAAAKLVTALGAALALAFGASIISSIAKVNTALSITAGLSNLIGKGPLGIIAKLAAAGAGVAGAAVALDELMKKNDALTESATKAAEAQKAAATAGGDGQRASATQDPRSTLFGKILPAKPSEGDAKRRQELDARQKAVLESEKRIAESAEEVKKFAAIAGASDLEKIAIESAADIAKARLEINAKEHLSQAQKDREFAAKRAEIEAKAGEQSRQARLDQERTLNQQKQQYASANLAMLGIEQTEVQRITDLIALQPEKYKEIGRAMMANAAIQDAEKKRLEEILRLRGAEKQAYMDYNAGLVSAGAASANLTALIGERLGKSQEELTILRARADAAQKLYELENTAPGAYEARLITEGRISELTKEQIAQAKTYNELLAFRKGLIQAELQDKILLAETDAKLAKDFNVGWTAAYNKYLQDTQRTADQAKTYFETFTKGLEDAFVKFVQTGKLSFKDLANSLIADFARIQAKKAISGIFEMGGGAGGGFGSFFGGIGKLFGFANGGNPAVGVPSIVGENGPELFIPRNAGTIIPNSALGGSTNNTAVTYNINAVDAASFQQLVARDPKFLHAVVEKGRRSIPQGAQR